MNRAVILTAIPVEYIAVKDHLSGLKEETHKGTVYQRGQFSDNGKSWEVGIVEIDPGNTRAAMEAERAIAYFNPAVVLFVGVAGGIKDVKLGDVVAATKVYGYESGKTEIEFKPRPDVGQSSYNLIQRARAEAKKSDWLERRTSVDSTVDSPRVLVEPIAAGEKVVASKKSSTFEFLRKNYGDAVAVEMEGSGLLKAAHANHQVSALIIRGISDLIDSKSEADAASLPEIAAQNASAFAFEILAKLELTIPFETETKEQLNSPSNIIERGTPYFVGRDTQLDKLHQELQKTDRLAICAIAGMGGVGKTELALQYALRYQDNYPGGRCWFPVRGLDLGIQVVSFGRTELGLTIPDDLEFKEQVRYCWRNWPEGTVLIVLDDVASFSNDYKQRIKPYLPPAESRFKVLVTSRQRPGASYRRIDLDVLSPEAALELLGKLVGKERIEKELTEAEALCEWLGYLPLGLELVGRYLYLHPTLTIAKVQKRLEKKKLAAKALLDPTEEGEMTAQWGVAAAFELSWEDLKDCPEAQQLGCRLSLFAPAPFEWSLVEKCVIETEDEDDWEEAQEDLEELRDRFLINRNLLQLTEQQTYRLHPLIREFFQTKLAQLPEADSYKRSFCQAMVAVAQLIPERPTLEIIAVVTPAIPHLEEVATVLTDWLRDEDLIEPFTGLGRFSEGQGTYDQAEPWYGKCLEITRSRLGEEHRDVALSLNNLAALYKAQGRYDEVEPLLVEALEIYKHQLGEDHPHVADSLNNLAALYCDQGRYDQAETLLVEASELYKHGLGKDHPNVAISLNNLAGLYCDQGRYNQAEALYVEVLEMRKQRLGENHPDVATSLNNLATLYCDQGRYDQAETLLVEGLKLYKQLLGENHPNVVKSLNNLAVLYKAQGRYDQAEALYLKALEIRKNLLGEDHPDVATSLNNLAALYHNQGRYDHAEPLYFHALEIYKHRLPEEHPNVAQILNNLANLYSAQGRYDQAKPLFVKALEITKKRLGENHLSVAQSLNNLAALYQAQRHYHEAEPLYVQALELFKQLLGEDHPSVAQSLNNLALLYHYQGRYHEAQPLYVQALKLFKQLLGEDHPSVASNINNLAGLYYEQGRYHEAEPLYVQALEIRKHRLGENHPDVANSLNNLALLYHAQGRYHEAEPLFVQALDIAEHKLGSDHPNTVTYRNNLESLRNDLSQ